MPGRCDTGGLPWNFAVRLAPCDADVQSLAFSVIHSRAVPERFEHDHRLRRRLWRQCRDTERDDSVDNAEPQLRSRTSWTRVTQSSLRESRTLTPGFAPRSSTFELSERKAGFRWTRACRRRSAGSGRLLFCSTGRIRVPGRGRRCAGNLLRRRFGPTAAMRLQFPLRSRVELRTSLGEGGATGQTVRYGTDPGPRAPPGLTASRSPDSR